MLAEQKTVIGEAVDARKEPIAGEAAWELLKAASEIVVGKGKKFEHFQPTDASKAELLENCLGRTGNLRAPTLKIGSRLIVGFNEDMYGKYLGR